MRKEAEDMTAAAANPMMNGDPILGLKEVPQTYRQRRIAILGASSVGKSSVTARFVYDQFDHSYLPTIEDEHHKVVSVDGKDYYLEILDTSGQDEYSNLGIHCTIGSHAYIMMFSVNDKNSFEIIKKVNDKLLIALAAESNEVRRILVGNKIDIAEERQVHMVEAKAFCVAQGIPYIECSAATGENVIQVFTTVIRAMESFERVPKSKSLEKKDGFCGLQ